MHPQRYRGRKQHRRQLRLRFRRAFTLIELLVVIALTALLMTILFVPLSRSIDLVNRGNARVSGIDNVRNAQRRLGKELEQAMEVFEPRPILMWGYNAWTFRRERGVPALGAQPESYMAPASVLSMRLPKHRYFCSQYDHYVTPEDLDVVIPQPRLYDDAVALDFCPRHTGSPVEFRPLSPLEPDDRIVAYFVALKDPRLRLPTTAGLAAVNDARPPFYRNLALFGGVGNADLDDNMLNTYALFRVEFDPRNPNFANWNEDLNGNGTLDSGEDVDGDGRLGPNPNFFYDTRAASGAGGNGQPFCNNWYNNTIQVMDVNTGDAVRWLEAGGKYIPHPLVSFTPTSVDQEVLQPNRNVGQYALFGGPLPAAIPPFEFASDHGHLTGVVRDAFGRVDDGLRPLPDNVGCAPSAVGGLQLGPRIQVLEQGTGGALNIVFDSANGGLRNRMVGYNQATGNVSMAIPRRDYSAASPRLRDFFSATVTGYYQAWIGDDPTTGAVDGDQVQDPTGLPSSFGRAKASPRFAANAMIVPGAEVVQVLDTSVTPNLVEPLRRVGWTGLGEALDRYVAQADLGRDEYTIDYRTGMITLSDDDPAYWNGVAPGNSRQLLVRYQFQTNAVTDIVRMSYQTRELATVNLGVVQFTRKNREALPFEVSQQIEVRNLKR